MFKTHYATTWGLDIGETSLKLAAVIPSANGSYELTNIGQLIFDDSNSRNILDDPKQLSLKIKQLMEKTQGRKLKSQFIHACIPDTDTFVKLIEIPDMTDEEIPEAVKWASEQHIPLPVDSMYLDWHVVTHDPHHKKITILLGAVKREISNTFTEAIKLAGLIPLSLDVEATAITRALQPLFTSEKTDKPEPNKTYAILDLGATHTSLIIYSQNTIQFVAGIPLDGRNVTEKLAQNLHIATQEAEKAKLICGLTNPDCENALLTILNDDFKAMTAKIKESFDYYNATVDEPRAISELILCGGGAYLDGLDVLCEKELKIPVRHGSLSNSLIIPSELHSFQSHDLSFVTALGLAKKAYE